MKETHSQEEVLTTKTIMIQQIKEFTTTFQPDMKPNIKADMTFSATDITALCQNYGQVSALALPDPPSCYAVGRGIEAAIVGEKSTIFLEANLARNQSCL